MIRYEILSIFSWIPFIGFYFVGQVEYEWNRDTFYRWLIYQFIAIMITIGFITNWNFQLLWT